MNQKHLLRFIKKRMKTSADDVVGQDDSGNGMTLKEVSFPLSPYFLSGMLPDKQKDNF